MNFFKCRKRHTVNIDQLTCQRCWNWTCWHCPWAWLTLFQTCHPQWPCRPPTWAWTSCRWWWCRPCPCSATLFPRQPSWCRQRCGRCHLPSCWHGSTHWSLRGSGCTSLVARSLRPEPLRPQPVLQVRQDSIDRVHRGPVLCPDVILLAIGGIKDGEDLPDQDGLLLGSVHGALDPDAWKCLAIWPNKPKEHSFLWKFGVPLEPVHRVHSLGGGCKGPVVPPVKVLAQVEVLIAEYQDLASRLSLHFVDHGFAHSQPPLPL